jgi:hypothetical protein
MTCNIDKKKKPKQKREPSKYAKIIENIVFVKKGGTFWGKETKLLKTLMIEYPEESFWFSVRFFPKLNTLLEFFYDPLKTELQTRYKSRNLTFDIPEYKKIKLTKRKFGEKPVLDKPPRTIREFLSNGKKKTRNKAE